eukprot:540763_1
MNNQQYNEWIPYLKLNHINHQIGFIIPWNIMHQIKYYYDEFTNDKTKANYTKSAFTLDFHCGITDRTLIHGILLINKIRFHAISYHQLVKYGVPSHRCLYEPQYKEKTFFNLSPTTKNHRCGDKNHPQYKYIHHPLYKNDTNVKRIDDCGYAFAFDMCLMDFIEELSKQHKIDMSVIDWNTYDIPHFSLQQYLKENNIIPSSPKKSIKRALTIKWNRANVGQKLNNGTIYFKTNINKNKNMLQHESFDPISMTDNIITTNIQKQQTKPKRQTTTTMNKKPTKKTISTHPACLGPVQKELLPLRDLSFKCKRFDKKLVAVCLRYGIRKSHAIRQINYLQGKPNAKDWNAIRMLPDLDISIYSDDEEEDEMELHCPVEFAKQYLIDKYKTSSNLNDIYNKKYNALHILKNARNDL